MGILEWFGLRRLAPAVAGLPARQARQFLAGTTDRLSQDLVPFSATRPINQDLKGTLATMRARSRYIARNNDHARAFFRLVRRNIIGAYGIAVQMQVKTRTGTSDKNANDRIEQAYAQWSRRGVMTVDGLYGRAEVERLIVQQVATDGEVFVRLVRGYKGNSWAFAIQLIDADALPEQLNVPRGSGYVDGGHRLAVEHEIVLGVERDQALRPVAYWFRADSSTVSVQQRYQRVPAGDVLHVFRPEQIGQARGIPWLFCGMRRLAMLGGYEEAELVAARVASSKMGFFTEADNGETVQPAGVDAAGAPVVEAQPGTFETLPRGVDFKPFDPQHPTQAFGDFVKAMLRGISSGAGVSYSALTGDLENANYSSLRQGALEERDEWRVAQSWFTENFSEPVFTEWLQHALAFGSLPGLSPLEEARWNAPAFVPRGWQWVDPAKEIDADERAVRLGVKTRRQICAERGQDFDEIIVQLAEEAALAKAAGVDISGSINAPQAAAPQEPTQGDITNGTA